MKTKKTIYLVHFHDFLANFSDSEIFEDKDLIKYYANLDQANIPSEDIKMLINFRAPSEGRVTQIGPNLRKYDGKELEIFIRRIKL